MERRRDNGGDGDDGSDADSDADWAAEFGLDEAEGAMPATQMIGRQANPLDKASWDDDFDFDEDNKVFRAASTSGAQRRANAKQFTPAIQHARQSLLFGQEFADIDGMTAQAAELTVESTSTASNTGAATSTDESNTITGDDEDSDEDWDKEFRVQTLSSESSGSVLSTLKRTLFFGDAPSAGLASEAGSRAATPLQADALPVSPEAGEDPVLEYTVPRPSSARVNIVLYPKASQLYDLKTADGRRVTATETGLETWLRDLFRGMPSGTSDNFNVPLFRLSTIGGKRKISGQREQARSRPLSSADVDQLVNGALANSNIDSNLALQRALHSMLKAHPSVASIMINDWIAGVQKHGESVISPDNPLWWQTQQILYICVKHEHATPQDGSTIPTLASIDERLRPLGPTWGLLLDHTAWLLEAHNRTVRGGSGPFDALAWLALKHEALAVRAHEFGEDTLLAVRADLVSSIVMILHGVSPLTLVNQAPSDDDGDQSPIRESQIPLLSLLVTSGTHRLEALRQALPCLPAGYFRARVAFALASEILRELNDTNTAENLLYECLYILEHAPELRPCLLGQLGFQAVLLYGEVLLANNKYKFAILSLEGALYNLHIRDKDGELRRTIERKLAVIAYQQSDWTRALQFYRSVYNFARSENKLNEIVHVALMINQVYVELGDSQGAEEILLRAIELFTAPTTTSTPGTAPQNSFGNTMKPVFWALPQRLCEVYLKFGCHDACVAWLERAFLTDFIPVNKMAIFCYLLAEAYSGKEWTKDVFSVLALFDLGSGGIPARIALRYAPSINSAKSGALANNGSSSTPLGNNQGSSSSPAIGPNENVNPVVEYIAKYTLGGSLLKLPVEGMYHDSTKLAVNTCLAAGRIEDALAIVNSAIKLCGEANLMSKGRLWLLKGKATVASTWVNPYAGLESTSSSSSSSEFDSREFTSRLRHRAAAFTNTISAATSGKHRSRATVVSATLPSRRNLPLAPVKVDTQTSGAPPQTAVNVRALNLNKVPQLVPGNNNVATITPPSPVLPSPLHLMAAELLPSATVNLISPVNSGGQVSAGTPSATSAISIPMSATTTSFGQYVPLRSPRSASAPAPSFSGVSSTSLTSPSMDEATVLKVTTGKAVAKHDSLPDPRSPLSPESLSSSVSSATSAHHPTSTFPRSLSSIAAACFTRAVGYFLSAADRVHVAKCRSLSAAHSLDKWMQAWATWQHSPINTPLSERFVPPFEIKPSALVDVRSLTRAAGDFFFATCHIKGMLQTLLSLAELELLNSVKDNKKLRLSQAYWKEAYFLFTTVFVRNNDILLRRRAPPYFLEYIQRQCKRLVRLLFLYPGMFASDYLAAFELYIRAQQAAHLALMRPVPRTRVPFENTMQGESARKGTASRPLLLSLFPSSGSRRKSTTPIEPFPPSLLDQMMSSSSSAASSVSTTGTEVSTTTISSSGATKSATPVSTRTATTDEHSTGSTTSNTSSRAGADGDAPRPSAGASNTASSSSANHPATLSASLHTTRDPIMEKSWSAFKLMSANFALFSAGRLSEEKLLASNQDLLYRLQVLTKPIAATRAERKAQAMKRRDSVVDAMVRRSYMGDSAGENGTENSSLSDHLSTSPANTSDLATSLISYTYQQWSHRIKKDLLDGVVIVFEMDGCLATFVPSTGFRSLKRLPQGLRTSTASDMVSVMLQIQESYAMFKMSSDTTLDMFATYLMTLVPAKTHDIDTILSLPTGSSSSALPTVGDPTTPMQLPGGGTIYIDHFSSNFWNLLRGMGKPTSQPAEPVACTSDRVVYCFVTPRERPEDILDPSEHQSVRHAFLSLAHCMQVPLGTLATDMGAAWDGRPMHVHFVACTEQDESRMRRWDAPHASPALVGFLQNLAAIHRDSPMATKAGSLVQGHLIQDLHRMLVPWIDEAVLSLAEKKPSKLTLLTSSMYQLLPWSELIHNVFGIHATLSLGSLLRTQSFLNATTAATLPAASTNSSSASSSPTSGSPPSLRFVVFYYDRETEEPMELYKERILLDEIMAQLVGQMKNVIRGSESSWPWLLQSPLVRKGRKISSYRKKYKRAEFIDLSNVTKVYRPHRDPLAFVRDIMYDRHGDRGGPIVFVLSSAELLAMTDWLECLLSADGQLALVLAPAITVKRVMMLLNDYLDEHLTMDKQPLDVLEQGVMTARNQLHCVVVLLRSPVLLSPLQPS